MVVDIVAVNRLIVAGLLLQLFWIHWKPYYHTNQITHFACSPTAPFGHTFQNDPLLILDRTWSDTKLLLYFFPLAAEVLTSFKHSSKALTLTLSHVSVHKIPISQWGHSVPSSILNLISRFTQQKDCILSMAAAELLYHILTKYLNFGQITYGLVVRVGIYLTWWEWVMVVRIN